MKQLIESKLHKLIKEEFNKILLESSSIPKEYNTAIKEWSNAQTLIYSAIEKMQTSHRTWMNLHTQFIKSGQYEAADFIYRNLNVDGNIIFLLRDAMKRYAFSQAFLEKASDLKLTKPIMIKNTVPGSNFKNDELSDILNYVLSNLKKESKYIYNRDKRLFDSEIALFNTLYYFRKALLADVKLIVQYNKIFNKYGVNIDQVDDTNIVFNRK